MSRNLKEKSDRLLGQEQGGVRKDWGGRVAFVFTEVFTLTGDRISRLETFHINVGSPGDTLFTNPAG